MPELPDLELYLTSLRRVAGGCELVRFRTFNPFVLRTVKPQPVLLEGKVLRRVGRLGKRLVLDFSPGPIVVVHLMIAGRLRWHDNPAKPNKIVHAAFEFANGALHLTEASSKKRASISLFASEDEVLRTDRGGLELLSSDDEDRLLVRTSFEAFASRLVSENRTLKRALTDPRLISGIGNAYSDEILHAARLSPMKLSRSLNDQETRRLYDVTLETLEHWTLKLRGEFAKKFPGPGDITAFRPDFAVHGKFGQPCPVCGSKVQRIAYADNETNYCAKCQNEGRLLADRALSRLLKEDWPKRLEQIAE